MSPVSQIASLAKKSDMSAEIGFMGKVRLEILYIVAGLRYFSLILRKNIKVCIIIEDISFLNLTKVLQVFEVRVLPLLLFIMANVALQKGYLNLV